MSTAKDKTDAADKRLEEGATPRLTIGCYHQNRLSLAGGCPSVEAHERRFRSELSQAPADREFMAWTNRPDDSLREVVEAAKALVEKLDECKPAIGNAFVLTAIHGMNYEGPEFGTAHEALRAALAHAEEVRKR